MGIFSQWFSSRTPSDIDARLVPVLQMMSLDGRFDAREGQTLRAYITRLGISQEQVEIVHKRATGKQIPIPTDPRQKLEVLSGAALMMICDGDIDVRELAFFHVIAARMQIPPEIASSLLLQSVKLVGNLQPDFDLERELTSALAALDKHL